MSVQNASFFIEVQKELIDIYDEYFSIEELDELAEKFIEHRKGYYINDLNKSTIPKQDFIDYIYWR